MIYSNPRELCYSDYIGKSRVLCLDYGDKRIGVAISDLNWVISSPLKVVESHGAYPDLLWIIEANEVEIVLVGAPKALNGGESGKQLEKVKKFVNKLDEIAQGKLRIVYWDERLSSVAATRFLDEANLSLSSKKKRIDKVAASFILRGFLDFVRYSVVD